MIGLDTGFFVELLLGNTETYGTWKTLIDGDAEGSVSCLTLFEIERLGLRGALPDYKTLLEGIPAVCSVQWVQDMELLEYAAGLSHGLGIPAMDSVILACLLSSGSTRILTTDSHFEFYRKKGIRIDNLRKQAMGP